MSEFNYVVPAGNMTAFDWNLVKEVVMDREPYEVLDRRATIYDVLVKAGVFRSKNEARRNWKRGPLKEGLNDFKDVGKLRHRIFVQVMPELLPELIP